MLFAGEELFDVLINGNSARLFGIMLHVKQTYLIVEYCKKSNFGQKTKRENGKKRKHRKKTIQVSNFHNAAEADVNLTWREQV